MTVNLHSKNRHDVALQ